MQEDNTQEPKLKVGEKDANGLTYLGDYMGRNLFLDARNMKTLTFHEAVAFLFPKPNEPQSKERWLVSSADYSPEDRRSIAERVIYSVRFPDGAEDWMRRSGSEPFKPKDFKPIKPKDAGLDKK